jgi:hypothetical protein
MEDEFTSLEKDVIKSLKKEISSREDAERGLAYYKMLFEPALDLAEKAVKRYTKILKAADTENIPEDAIAYHIVGLFESALMDRIKGVKNENN